MYHTVFVTIQFPCCSFPWWKRQTDFSALHLCRFARFVGFQEKNLVIAMKLLLNSLFISLVVRQTININKYPLSFSVFVRKMLAPNSQKSKKCSIQTRQDFVWKIEPLSDWILFWLYIIWIERLVFIYISMFSVIIRLHVEILSFVSKLLERAVHAQLLLYLNDNELLPSVQSAYRQFFSTETAVLKVVTDILATLDRGQKSLLGMFDLSAAFDTVDHSILLRRMEISFGIRGAALEWFSSYLTGRSQQVSS